MQRRQGTAAISIKRDVIEMGIEHIGTKSSEMKGICKIHNKLLIKDAI